MAKRNDIPESMCLFNKDELNYIGFAAKKIPYNIDIQKAEIHVPPGSFDDAVDDLYIRDLVTKFGFEVQSTIGAVKIDLNEFKPEYVTDRAKAAADKVRAAQPQAVTLIKVGTMMNDINARCVKKIVKDKGKDWEIQCLDSMIPNYFQEKTVTDIAIKHGILKIVKI